MSSEFLRQPFVKPGRNSDSVDVYEDRGLEVSEEKFIEIHSLVLHVPIRGERRDLHLLYNTCVARLS